MHFSIEFAIFTLFWSLRVYSDSVEWRVVCLNGTDAYLQPLLSDVVKSTSIYSTWTKCKSITGNLGALLYVALIIHQKLFNVLLDEGSTVRVRKDVLSNHMILGHQPVLKPTCVTQCEVQYANCLATMFCYLISHRYFYVVHQISHKKNRWSYSPQYTQAHFAISVQVWVKPDLPPSSGH